jgi:hypothetical protein
MEGDDSFLGMAIGITCHPLALPAWLVILVLLAG